ncbi:MULTISPECIES: HTTM domain-containing protein [Streptomyces]|uniref:HTTM domain-containing protein n=1 Tax=Streptomyces TaxID=1883 RepID=UPI001962DDD7|nr:MULTISPECIES: HTTM domain-containing protein [Streptomyces]QRX93186.1 HTTM domain-containing protein [Streptomyces noursei]UJB42898.1 HTTM domain-containing protein [Streptomyces sp. A1-5]
MTSPTPQQPRTAARTPDAPAQTPQEAPAAYQETRIERAVGRGFARVAARALAPYQTAVIRIGFAGTWLLFLLREWPHRQQLYGPAGPWDFGMARQLLNGNHGFSVLVWSDGRGWFECVYVLAIVVSALLMLGWRTRTMSVLFMVGVLSLQNRSVFIGDGGDNVIHLMAIYLVLTRCGQVWSLDARRARRAAAAPGGDAAVPPRDLTGIVLWAVLGLALAVAQLSGAPGLTWFGHGPFPHFGWSLALWGLWATHGLWWAVRRHAPGEPRVVLDTLAKLAHNAALLVIMVEVCLVYATAGWYKIQGSRWQDGTAVYYPMHLDYFSPWPELSQLLGGNGLVIMLITYGTVIFQVAFPFTVFNRRLKNALLVVMICEHLSIAFLLGLPFFSLAMITADAVFLPTNFLTWLGGRLTRLRRRLFRRTGDPGAGTGDHGPGTAAGGAGPEAAARSGGDGQPLVG